jgi:hypothetical protein
MLGGSGREAQHRFAISSRIGMMRQPRKVRCPARRLRQRDQRAPV